MLVLTLIGGFVLSLGAALGLIPLVRRVGLRLGWMDRPDGQRKVHVRPIPRVGGVAILGAVVLSCAALLLVRPWLPEAVGEALRLPAWPVLLGAFLMALVGFADDVHDLNALPKLIAQTLIAGLVVAGGIRITAFDAALGGGEAAFAVSALLTVVWVVGTINGVNFIDGLDGLAGGVLTIAFVGLGAAFLLGGAPAGLLVAVTTVGAILGFLRYNAAPASIFMGDVGSHFLGYTLAVFALQGTAHPDPVLALVVAASAMGLPVLDGIVTTIRRPQYDKPLLHSDGDHFHHRLLLRYPKATVVRILWALSGAFAVGAAAMAASPAPVALALFALGMLSVLGFLYWLGYLPGRFAAGPADRRAHPLPEALLDAPSSGDGSSMPVGSPVIQSSRPPVNGVGAHAEAGPTQALSPATAQER